MRIDLISLFPEFVAQCAGFGVVGRARERGLLSVHGWNPRDYAGGNYRRVDDRPFGGGPGMVMKPEPFFEAIDDLKPAGPILLMSARGRRFTHDDAVRLAVEREITLLCGHYKDVDQRVADHLATEEISLGDFVLSGGEIAALAVADAVIRLLPGALGTHEAASSDSFYDEALLSPPSYTRPASYRGLDVPPVLLSGHAAKIAAWRRAEAERLTRERRPDLWERHVRQMEDPATD